MAWVSYRGIEIAHWLQNVLVGIQYLALGVLVVVALIAVAGPNRPDTAIPIEGSWFNPLGFFAEDGGGFAALTEGMLLMVFIYWGWDTILSLNEETKEREKTPRTRGCRRDAHPAGDVPADHRGRDLVRRRRDRRHRAGQRGQRRRRVPRDQRAGARRLELDRAARRPGVGGRLHPDDDPAGGTRHARYGCLPGAPDPVREDPSQVTRPRPSRRCSSAVSRS